MLAANVLVIGYLFGDMLSLGRFVAWIHGGISFSLLSVVFALTAILGLLTDKNWYCSFVCPYGSAQELVGKLVRKKKPVPFWARKYLILLRRIFMLVIVGLAIFAVPVDFINFEPFAAFQITSVPIPALILAGFFLLVSLAVPRCWCAYLCPTGQILELFQRPLIKRNTDLKKECVS
ncbi:MAG: 4Fe-4S binding protein [Candidatus Auribacterota bacterium]|nr:4Fe-4S binding protein [Candidatus Auribacterota bacterium]